MSNELLDFSRYHVQSRPSPQNLYHSTSYVRNLLAHYVDHKDFKQMEKELEQFGDRVVTEVSVLGTRASQDHNLPKLYQYDGWGKRIDEIYVCEEWKQLHDIAAEEGLISIGYEKKQGEYSRLFQFMKIYLYSPWSAIVTCPLSMTDGAARLIEQLYLSPSAPYYNHNTVWFFFLLFSFFVVFIHFFTHTISSL